MEGSHAVRRQTSALFQTLVQEVMHARPLDSGSAMRETDLMGLMLGHVVDLPESMEHRAEAPIDIRRCARLLGDIESQRGGRFSVGTVAEGCIQLVTRHCPFTDGAVDAPHLCEVAIGALGTLAARHFGYGKVELRQRMTNAECCEIWLHTDSRKAAGYPGRTYLRIGDRICAQPPCAEEAALADDAKPATGGHGGPVIVARSQAMQAVVRAIDTVAPARTTVLISGETGVGKELVARRLHARSPRARKPFVALNCGALPENLVESALFGHEKGAFTGAHERRLGVFERADGGTLFLDEIDSLPLAAQTRLLRVLQEGEFERVGGRRPLACDVRVVAACNAALEERVAEGRFRRDLYYRVHVVGIAIAPLRERREDIAPLVEHILACLRRRQGSPVHEIGPQALEALLAHDWPGNVRELENVLERSCLFCSGSRLDRVDLGPAAARAGAPHPARRPAASLKEHRRRAADAEERELLCAALRAADGCVAAVAQGMGVSARAVYLRLRRHGIELAAFRRNG